MKKGSTFCTGLHSLMKFVALSDATQHLQGCFIGFVGDCTLLHNSTPILILVLNLGLSLMSMKMILTNYGTVYLSNWYVSHGVSLGLLVKRDDIKLPSFLASGSIEVIV
jgi:hypothetical protein